MITKINHLNEVKLKKGDKLQIINHKRNMDSIFIGTLVSNKRVKKSNVWCLEIEVESQTTESFEVVNPNAFKYATIKKIENE
jgi:hypothetical protein